MKKLLLLGVFLLSSLCTACQNCDHDYELTLTSDNGWHTCTAGTDFDSSNIELSLVCKKCGKSTLIEDFDLENAEDLQLDQESVTFKYKNFELDYPITVKEKYHIACCGDSLTDGHYWKDKAYPVYLSNKVTSNYEVLKCGKDGASVTGYGGNQLKYSEQPVYQDSINFAPDIIAMMLGTNDATGWKDAEATFVDDYKALLDSYLDLFPKVKIIMMVSPPTTTPNQFNIPNDTIRDIVNPIQRELAEEYGFEVLDLREEFEAETDYETKYLRPNGDGVHFTEAAADFVAERVWDIAKNLRF